MGVAAARARRGGLVFGAMAAEAVFTAARLRVADLLGDGQRSGAAIAKEIGADEGALTRLRALAALELVSEPEPAQFRLTEAGQLPRSDRPESMHAFVRMFGDQTMLSAWRELDTAVRTGEATFDKVYGTSFFEHLSANPELSELFARSVAPWDGTLLAAVLQAYPGRWMMGDSLYKFNLRRRHCEATEAS
jgi:hypothetical protein